MVERDTVQSRRPPEGPDPLEGQLVAGRYRIRSRIARGGVGAVYRAFDESKGEEVALKRLLSHVAHSSRMGMLFEREYQTLAEIRHPRIIEVYDYGVDESGPYYTMELLGGKDLDELAPIPYREACSYLRDVATSLALLHTRHLLHRDLSPRNVRMTGDGRCKVLDFGTMANFGVPEEIVGTPPMVPPETLRGMPLDQRADLYALGALGYRILTRTYAYRARRLEDLPQVWQTAPPPPSSIVAGIPPELDTLILSLLSLDPIVRPASTTEVIDRLNAIADLPADPDEVRTAQAYLLRCRMIGRERHVERIKRRIVRAEAGQGSTVLVEGNPGVGKSRLLDEASLQAQLHGALVLRVDARANRGPNSVLVSLARALLHAAPQPALDAAAPHVGVLGHLVDELAERRSGEFTHLQPRQRRARLQAAMLQWLLDLSREHTLAVLVDDIHRCDESSGALLAALAQQSRRHRILLVATRRLAGPVAAPDAITTIVHHARRLRLHRLRRQDTADLVEALFGTVPNVGTLAQWIHGVTTGSPMQIMTLSQHLIDRGVVRYADGLWVLPTEVSTAELPVGLAATLSARLAALPPRARRLAEALSIRRGHLPLDLCVALADEQDRAEAFPLIDALVAQGVLTAVGDSYAFGQEVLRETLLAEMGAERARELHLRLAQVLLATEDLRPEDEIEAGWHLLRGGQERRGAARLAAAAPKLAMRGDATAAALPALEAALETYERHRRSPSTCLELRVALVRSADRTMAERHGDETLDKLAAAGGLTTARRLRPLVGGWLAIRLGIAFAGLRWLVTPASRRTLSPVRAIQSLFECSFALLPVRAAVMDLVGMKRVRRLTELLASLSAAGRAGDLVLQAAVLGLQARYHESREAIVRAREVLDAHPKMPRLSFASRRGLLVGILNTRGVIEAQHSVNGKAVLETVAELDAMAAEDPSKPTPDGVNLEQVVTNLEITGTATQLRILFHLMRGEREEAEKYRERFALHGIQTGLSWLHDVWRTLLESVASTRSGDLTGLRRALEQLRQFVEDLPQLRSFLEVYEANLALALGRPREARVTLERCAKVFAPGELAGWDNTHHSLALALIELGEPQAAIDLVERLQPHLGPSENPIAARVLFECDAILARAHLGEHERAHRDMEGLIRRLTNADNPMVLGYLHETGARVAWLAGAQDRLKAHTEHMQAWYATTRNPALLTRAQRVVRLAESPPSAEPRTADDDLDVATRMTTHRDAQSVHEILAGCDTPRERARTALHLVMQRAAGTEGHFYLWRRGRLRLAASIEAGEPQDELERQIRRQIEHYVSDVQTESEGPATSAPTLLTLTGDDETRDARFAIMLLSRDEEAAPRVVGAVALRIGAEMPRAVPRSYLDAVALHFDEATGGSLPPSTVPPPPTAPSLPP